MAERDDKDALARVQTRADASNAGYAANHATLLSSSVKVVSVNAGSVGESADELAGAGMWWRGWRGWLVGVVVGVVARARSVKRGYAPSPQAMALVPLASAPVVPADPGYELDRVGHQKPSGNLVNGCNPVTDFCPIR